MISNCGCLYSAIGVVRGFNYYREKRGSCTVRMCFGGGGGGGGGGSALPCPGRILVFFFYPPSFLPPFTLLGTMHRT